MKNWLSYAAAGLVLTLLAALVAAALVRSEARSAVWFAAGLAYVLQLAAYGAIIALRDNPQLFMIGWASGILLRFMAVGAVAFVLPRWQLLPLHETLISLVTFVVLLLFLEPFFLRRGRA